MARANGTSTAAQLFAPPQREGHADVAPALQAFWLIGWNEFLFKTSGDMPAWQCSQENGQSTAVLAHSSPGVSQDPLEAETAPVSSWHMPSKFETFGVVVDVCGRNFQLSAQFARTAAVVSNSLSIFPCAGAWSWRPRAKEGSAHCTFHGYAKLVKLGCRHL